MIGKHDVSDDIGEVDDDVGGDGDDNDDTKYVYWLSRIYSHVLRQVLCIVQDHVFQVCHFHDDDDAV